MTRRQAITDKMKWKCLLHRRPVYCSLCYLQLLGPESDMEWDHVWEIADEGPHDYQNLRPVCPECHRKKSGKACTQRAHIKRLAAGPKKSKRPMPKSQRKMQSRGFR